MANFLPLISRVTMDIIVDPCAVNVADKKLNKRRRCPDETGNAKINGKTLADVRYFPAIRSTDWAIRLYNTFFFSFFSFLFFLSSFFSFCLLHGFSFLDLLDTLLLDLFYTAYHDHGRRILLSPSPNPRLRRSPLRL